MTQRMIMTACLVTMMAATAQAQVRPWYYPPAYGGGYPSFSSTVGESHARGMADLVRASGENRYYSSAAAINYQDATSKYIDNRVKWHQAYYGMKRDYAAYADEVKQEKLAVRDKWLEAGGNTGPTRLSAGQLDPVTGAVNWPEALQAPTFQDHRKEIDAILQYRAQTGTGSSALETAARAMLEELKTHIRDMPSSQYLAARKFLDGLIFEAQRPTT